MSKEANARLLRFAREVLGILRATTEDDPDIREIYRAAERCGLDTRHHSGDDD